MDLGNKSYLVPLSSPWWTPVEWAFRWRQGRSWKRSPVPGKMSCPVSKQHKSFNKLPKRGGSIKRHFRVYHLHYSLFHGWCLQSWSFTAVKFSAQTMWLCCELFVGSRIVFAFVSVLHKPAICHFVYIFLEVHLRYPFHLIEGLNYLKHFPQVNLAWIACMQQRLRNRQYLIENRFILQTCLLFINS